MKLKCLDNRNYYLYLCFAHSLIFSAAETVETEPGKESKHE
jgi:hypothetical protein